MNAQVEVGCSQSPPPMQRLFGARESPLELPWSDRKGQRAHSGRTAGAQRARCGRIDRPISAFSMWIVTA